MAHDQEKIDYDGWFNTMVGEFLGKTLNGKKQDLIGSILTFCLFCRQNGTTPEAMGDIITQIINKKDNVSFTALRLPRKPYSWVSIGLAGIKIVILNNNYCI